MLAGFIIEKDKYKSIFGSILRVSIDKRLKAMGRLWNKNWFKNLCIWASTLAAIVVVAVITPPRYINNAAAAEDDIMQITAAKLKDGEEFTVQDENIAVAKPSTKQIYGELLQPEHGECIAAKWVDEKIVLMTAQEIEEFEKQLYSSKTKQEYKTVMENIAYYNKVIEMKKFDWYLDEIADTFDDELKTNRD